MGQEVGCMNADKNPVPRHALRPIRRPPMKRLVEIWETEPNESEEEEIKQPQRKLKQRSLTQNVEVSASLPLPFAQYR